MALSGWQKPVSYRKYSCNLGMCNGRILPLAHRKARKEARDGVELDEKNRTLPARPLPPPAVSSPDAEIGGTVFLGMVEQSCTSNSAWAVLKELPLGSWPLSVAAFIINSGDLFCLEKIFFAYGLRVYCIMSLVYKHCHISPQSAYFHL